MLREILISDLKAFRFHMNFEFKFGPFQKNLIEVEKTMEIWGESTSVWRRWLDFFWLIPFLPQFKGHFFYSIIFNGNKEFLIGIRFFFFWIKFQVFNLNSNFIWKMSKQRIWLKKKIDGLNSIIQLISRKGRHQEKFDWTEKSNFRNKKEILSKKIGKSLSRFVPIDFLASVHSVRCSKSRLNNRVSILIWLAMSTCR